MQQRGNSQASWLIGVFLLATVQARAADKATPVDEEFLEYLGTVEDDGDNWMLFEDQQANKPPPETRKPTSKPPEDDAKSASKQK
jgi:hypothetical protein